MLVFRGVENAQKYLITVSCGNKDHKHEAFDNGLSCFYDFSTCEMQEGGIRFTVTAVADGYASSTATFTYDRRLDAVSGLAFRNDTLSWNAVPGATSYTVRVGDSTYTVTGTVLDLSALANGSYTASVTPVTKGYNSPCRHGAGAGEGDACRSRRPAVGRNPAHLVAGCRRFLL